MLFLLVLVGAGTFYYGKIQFEAPGPMAQDGAPESVILLPKGMSVKAIALYLGTTMIAISIALTLAVSIGPGANFTKGGREQNNGNGKQTAQGAA